MRTTLWSSTLGDIPASLAFTNNYSATSDPTATDDSSKKYEVGSIWVNTQTDVSFVCVDATAGSAIWNVSGQAVGFSTQGAPATQDTAATLTAAQILTGIIVSNPAGAIALTMPLATAMDTAIPRAVAGTSFDFSVINISGANAITMTTNTGWTLTAQGNMIVAGGASGRFRARKTGTGAWSLYRIS